MSDSRLEKFIYAICSMDVSDLPVPLSRIEKLWNCLITGETPDFEPLSRNEKYLMAMLDRYDISNLPAPMSRGEKLLYKIAVGETDLSDVPGYLSRYEELLKYLIENGGISGGDFEYVLYTLNQSLSTLYLTAEKPVKSAILKGNTLVNLSENNDYKTIDLTGMSSYVSDFQNNVEQYKPNTKYLVITEFESALNSKFGVTVQNGTTIFDKSIIIGSGYGNEGHKIYKHIITSKSDFTGCTTTLRTVVYANSENPNLKITYRTMIIEYQDGMENWDIPYFEGMQSVKMPVLTTYTNLFTGFITKGFIGTDGVHYGVDSDINYLSDFIEITNNKLSFRLFTSQDKPLYMFGEFAFYDKNKALISCKYGSTDEVIETPNGTKYIRVWGVDRANSTDNVKGMLIYSDEKPSNIATYKPHKTNILTTSEEVELRGIGEVRDELDLIRGELTQHIGESNSENFVKCSYSLTLFNGYYTAIIELNNKASSSVIMANLVPTQSFTDGLDCGIYNNPGNVVLFKKGATLEEIKNLVSNLIIQYQLAEKSVKTVDLTIQDQDGNETKLRTFDDTTHVLLESEGLIPTASLTVRTKIPSASSTSLLMDDISTEQQQLETTVDEQSNNVDATMIATTEIFEETL